MARATGDVDGEGCVLMVFWFLFLGCALFLWGFIAWSEWWVRRRILRYLRYMYPDWLTTKLIVEAMGCTRPAAITALDRLKAEGRIITAGDMHRAHGIEFTTEEVFR